jgi:hypothetical protein
MATLAAPDFALAVWRKSRRSQTLSDSCVEVARANHHIGVRDSKDRSAGHLVFGHAAWRTFTIAIKSGEHHL